MPRDLGFLISSIINFIFSLVIIGLVLRFFLRLFGANPEAGFVDFIYDSTGPLLDPFRGVFNAYVIDEGNILELSTLLAIAIYLLIAFLITEFIAYISYTGRTTYRRTVVRD